MRQIADQTAKNLAAPSSHRHAWRFLQRRNLSAMSSLPPVGGTTRRSRFAVWSAPILSLANIRFAVQICFDRRGAASGSNVRPRRWPLSPSAGLKSCWQTSQIKFGNSDLIAAGIRAAT
jgi:hypothetical protein